MVPTGIGVGLTFPTLMGVGASALPPSSFATGSGVINMIRQASLAIGVAMFVAVVGSPGVPASSPRRVSSRLVDHGGDHRVGIDPDLLFHPRQAKVPAVKASVTPAPAAHGAKA